MAHNHSVYLYQILFGKMQDEWSYGLDVPNSQNADMCFAIGLTIVIPLIFTPFVYKKISTDKRKLYCITLVAGVLFTILTSTIIPWNKIPVQINFIQYSYRFLLPATFLLSIVAAVNISKIVEEFSIKTIMIYTLIAFIYVTPLYQNATILKGVEWTEFYETEKIEENQRFSRYCATFEYLPSKAYNNMNYIANRSDEAIVQSGDCEVENFKKEKLVSEFSINGNHDETIIEMPYIYYQGYRAVGDNNNKFEILETNQGFVGVKIPKDYTGNIKVEYKGTTMSYLSMVISLIGSVTLIIYIVLQEKRYIKEKNC